MKVRKARKAEKVSQDGGYCCSYCADSKYPCVKTELGMKERAKETEPAAGGEKAEEKRSADH